MRYRPEIDGLRAVAVLPVILFHAGFSVFSGGYIGVDVFFVISGYLITQILLTDLDQSSFSIARFYERRARRILPALFVVVVACMPFAYLWMPPAELRDFAASIVAVVLFISNFYFLSQVDYFGPVAEYQPLMHTWSLAVEEQYYLLFPIFLLMVRKAGRRSAMLLVFLFVTLSLIFAEWAWRRDADRSFFFTLSRFWEIGIGSLCAFVAMERPLRPSNLFATAGIVMVIIPIFAYDESIPTPSLYTLVPVAGTALILLFARSGTSIAQLLSMRGFVAIGLISYSAYLWHQPLFAFARLRSLTEPSPYLMGTLAVATLLLAWATWHWVEQVFRERRPLIHLSRRQVFVASGTVGAIVAGIGLASYQSDGLTWRFSEKVMRFAEENIDRASNKNGCHLYLDDPISFPNPLCAFANSQGKIDVLLVGDSHTRVLSEPLVEFFKKNNIGYYQASYSGCLPFQKMQIFGSMANSKCQDFNKKIYLFASSRNIKNIVLAARFPQYLSGVAFNNGEGGIELGKDMWYDIEGISSSIADDDTRRGRVLAAYEQRIRDLAQQFNVILVYPIPEAGWDVPSYAFRSAMFNDSSVNLTTSYAAYKERTHEVNALFDRLIAELPNVTGARVQEGLCSQSTGRCLNADHNTVYYYDDNHLSSAGTRLVAPIVIEAVKKTMQKAD